MKRDKRDDEKKASLSQSSSNDDATSTTKKYHSIRESANNDKDGDSTKNNKTVYRAVKVRKSRSDEVGEVVAEKINSMNDVRLYSTSYEANAKIVARIPNEEPRSSFTNNNLHISKKAKDTTNANRPGAVAVHDVAAAKVISLDGTWLKYSTPYTNITSIAAPTSNNVQASNSNEDEEIEQRSSTNRENSLPSLNEIDSSSTTIITSSYGNEDNYSVDSEVGYHVCDNYEIPIANSVDDTEINLPHSESYQIEDGLIVVDAQVCIEFYLDSHVYFYHAKIDL